MPVGVATALLWLSLLLAQSAAAVPGAQPFFTRFHPSIETDPQNYDIAATAAGDVFVANTSGVLQFDGERWQLHALPGKQLVRSLLADGSRVYVGGFDQFGYLEPTAEGSYHYVDLADRFRATLGGQAFADIWNLLVTPEGVWFKALRHVFLWNPQQDTLRQWQHDGRFGAMVYHNDRTLLQFRGEGMRHFDGAEWQMLAGTAMLQDLLTELLPLPDGSLLASSRAGQWWQLAAAGVAPYSMPAEMPGSAEISSGEVLADATLAFSTDHGDMVFYDPVTRSATRATVESGFLGGLAVAPGQTLLVSANDGFYSFAWPSHWSLLPPQNGYGGTLNNVAVHANALYVLGSNGVYRQAGSDSRFTRLPWSSSETWDLLFLPDDSVLLADAQELKLIRGDTVTPVSSNLVYPRVLLHSQLNPALVYAGTEQGVAVLQQQADGWAVVYHNDQLDNLEVNSLVELPDGDLLIGSRRAGVQRWRLTNLNGWQLDTSAVALTDGLDYGESRHARLSRLADGSIIASTAAGLFRYDSGAFQREALAGLAELLDPAAVVALESAPDGATWAYNTNRLFLRADAEGWQPLSLSALHVSGLSGLAFTAAGEAVLSANSQLLVHTAPQPLLVSDSPPLRLVSVAQRTLEADNLPLPIAPAATPVIAQEDWLTFRFARTDFHNPDAVRYRSWLEPVDAGEPVWQESAQVAYFGLAAGDYRFHVQALDGQGVATSALDYAFTVAPHWYQLRSVQALLLALAFGAVAAVSSLWVRQRSQRLQANNQALERTVQERTRELKAANGRLEQLAHLDGLTAIPNRRRLDLYLDEVSRQCSERHRNLAVALIDVDFFKAYNDRHGHRAGDELLKALAQLLSRQLRRDEDLLARYGGEEFALVLPGVDCESAFAMVETLRQQVEQSDLGVTLSAGVACLYPKLPRPASPRDDSGADALMALADKALYQAKLSGRNRVCLA